MITFNVDGCRKHLGSLDIEMVNNKIIVRDWGPLVHLGESPCRQGALGVTLHYLEKNTGLKRQTDTKVEGKNVICFCLNQKLRMNKSV